MESPTWGGRGTRLHDGELITRLPRRVLSLPGKLSGPPRIPAGANNLTGSRWEPAPAYSGVSAVSAPLDRLYFEAGWACEKVSRTIWRFAWQMMDLLGATKLSSRAAETGVGPMM
ncbi:hypothetical protein CN090_34070 [Sinorhizobium meliloti]|nr:hypothetical protein CDO29_35405 [Sinorhizobium meliloti]RVN47727.1 hypothetical protein CN108_33610 [Sinorhizobium meliloti]RVN53149.1 hypothetical protein CN104_32890 [Sinorhizobium meliloti]RVO16438.1 hypothetical protein CN100_33180 [Sinorhizobium meliloti]RVO40207.1 hypothetical protein CN090_34070 [Sinorhizobium meliloti]